MQILTASMLKKRMLVFSNGTSPNWTSVATTKPDESRLICEGRPSFSAFAFLQNICKV